MVKSLKTDLMLISILLILTVSIGMVSASDDNQDMVNASSPDLVADGTQDIGTFSDIRAELNDVEENGTLYLNKQSYVAYKSDLENNLRIDINKSVSIVGTKQTAISANGGFGILNISDAGNVLIKNIKFCKYENNHAVIIKNSNVTFENCIFDNNPSSMGAAINVWGDEMDTTTNIINCTFNHNIARWGSGAVGGAISIGLSDVAATTNVVNSTFIDNSAYRGGAIYISGNDKKTGHLKVDNCNFINNYIIPNPVENEPDEIAGADIIIWQTVNYDVEITNTNFTNEKYSGEGMFEQGLNEASLVLTNGKNKIANCNFVNSTINFNDTEAFFEKCNFLNSNIELYLDVVNSELPVYDKLNLNICDCSFENGNVALGAGLINNSKFTKTLISKESDGQLTVDNCDFKSKSIVIISSKADISNSNFTDCSYIGSFSYLDLTIGDCNFIDGIDLCGAAINIERYDEGNLAKKQSRLTIVNSSFVNNTARYWGGAIYVNAFRTTIDISNSTFVNNSARNGGAIFANKSGGKVFNCVFEGNKAQNNDNITNSYFSDDVSDISLKYIFEYYEQVYYLDLEDWSGEYDFPHYTYGRQITDDGLVRTDYYGSCVFADKINIDNNFWGINVLSYDELILNRIINDKLCPTAWINYNGSFILSNGTKVSGMPNHVPNLAINKDAVISIVQKGSYFSNVSVVIQLHDGETKLPITNQEIMVTYSHGLIGHTFTDDNGTATFNIKHDAGKVAVMVMTEIPGYKVAECILDNVKINKILLTGKSTKLSTTYKSGKAIVITVSKKIGGVNLAIRVFTGKKYKTYNVFTNKNGVAAFKVMYNIAVGYHKVEIVSAEPNYSLGKIKTSIKITKAKTTVKAPKVTYKFKKSKYFKVTVKDKSTKKAVGAVKIKVKVFTGKKSKAYTIKTNKKGIASLNTKSLKIGRHNVVILSGNSNYAISAKSVITIKR